MLISVRRNQGTHNRRGFIGYLAQWIARQVRSGIFRYATLCRSRPAAQVDALNADSLDRDSLPRRVRSECCDRLACFKQLAQPLIKCIRRLSCNWIISPDRAALLDHLPRRIQANDSLEPRAGEVLASFLHRLFELTRYCQRTHKILLWQRLRNILCSGAIVPQPLHLFVMGTGPPSEGQGWL